MGVLLVSTVLGFESQLLLVGVEGDKFDNVDVFRCVWVRFSLRILRDDLLLNDSSFWRFDGRFRSVLLLLMATKQFSFLVWTYSACMDGRLGDPTWWLIISERTLLFIVFHRIRFLNKNFSLLLSGWCFSCWATCIRLLFDGKVFSFNAVDSCVDIRILLRDFALLNWRYRCNFEISRIFVSFWNSWLSFLISISIVSHVCWINSYGRHDFWLNVNLSTKLEFLYIKTMV